MLRGRIDRKTSHKSKNKAIRIFRTRPIEAGFLLRIILKRESRADENDSHFRRGGRPPRQ